MSATITVAAIAGTVGSSLGKIAEGAVNIIKLVAAIGFATVFASAIVNLVALVSSITSQSIVGEVMGIVSMCLPFNALTVFTSILGVMSAILAFLVARRVYMLTMNLIGITGNNA